ncbi:hypothetical protein [Rhodovulum sulfidophilum]|uniref:hypothetical protein n=1 Tax=Rhodovulum sulfidophilum TaxID=35806 RepID=UPI001F2B09E7|nr:hypothetical protein [Rhodovulum sulfidophilum]MCE8417819.1 hypothetical protein [Rhodovulum sulfidophilum]MCE8442237.1 hypothetical protein [Rhodovulum sulfidophilum]
MTQAALDEIVRDRIQDTLSIKLRDDHAPVPEKADPSHAAADAEIETTDEEREGFMIVRAIAAKIAPIERITITDAKSYCAILMNDNNRRPICRLYFNSPTTKNIGLFNAEKVETKVRVDGPANLYAHSDAIEAVVRSHLTA